MYITSVLSNLGAWQSIINDYTSELHELQNVIENTNTLYQPRQLTRMNRQTGYVPQILKFVPRIILNEKLSELGWKTGARLYLRGRPQRRYSQMDAIKNGIGVEYGFAKYAYIESHILVKIPLFIQFKRINIGLVLTLSEQLTNKFDTTASNYELIRDRLLILSPLARYPFAVIGISDKPQSINVEELTTELDQFLFKKTGYLLIDMLLQTEKQNYDFKVHLPTNDNITKEICAFANTPGGGLMIIGINDNGIIVGFPKADIDTAVSKVSNISRNNCLPPPHIEHYIFSINSSPDNCILIFKVHELERKPCMWSQKHRIYFRDNSQAVPAGPEHVRKIILGSGNY